MNEPLVNEIYESEFTFKMCFIQLIVKSSSQLKVIAFLRADSSMREMTEKLNY